MRGDKTMMEFTMVDYWRYQTKFPRNIVLSDQEEKYGSQKTHQYHDKVFKKILDNKKEFIHLIKRYTQYQTANLEEEKLEKCSPKLITSSFKAKELDIIYKVKGRDVFIIIEHQSTIDYKMPERMTEYCIQLIRTIKEGSKTETGLYPLICPIVFYTGRKRWDAPMSLTDMQEEYYGFEPLHYPRYNLIDINDYTKEELLLDNTAVAKAILFEKLSTKEEMKQMLEILTKKELTKQENKYLQVILNYSNDVRKKLDSEDILKYQEILEGGANMTNFERLLIELIEEKYEKRRIMEEEAKKKGQEIGQEIGKEIGKEIGQKIGKEIGQKIGQKNSLQKVISNMLKLKMNDKTILDVTQIDKNELQKIKQELKAC